MVRWVVGILIIFLLIDHFWVHVGKSYLDRLRGEYRQELKNATENETIELQESYKKSILDELWEKAKEVIQKAKKSEEGGK
ncbi:MAG: hypothetical protein ACK4LA_00040 [Aquificaceae bacterium]